METTKLAADMINTMNEKSAAQELKKAIQDEIQLSKNGEGYNDPTAYQAIKNIERQQKQPLKDDERFYKTLHSLFHVLELGGFDLEGRITLVDKRTGKVWR